MSPTRTRAWARMLAVCGLVVAADQATKGAVVESLARGERVDLLPGLDLVRVSNTGIAFGLLDDGADGLVFAVTGIALGAVTIWFALEPTRPGFWLAVGLLVGGALGNLVDRVREDAVTDFLDLVAWPAFNLADVAITAGVALIVLRALSAPGQPRPAPP